GGLGHGGGGPGVAAVRLGATRRCLGAHGATGDGCGGRRIRGCLRRRRVGRRGAPGPRRRDRAAMEARGRCRGDLRARPADSPGKRSRGGARAGPRRARGARRSAARCREAGSRLTWRQPRAPTSGRMSGTQTGGGRMAPHNGSPDGVTQLSAMLREAEYSEPHADHEPVDPIRRRQQRRRRGLIVGLAALVIVGIVGGYVGVSLSAPLPALTVETTTLRAPEPPAPATILTPPEGAWAISVAGADEYLGADAAGIWATSG